jgi:hypothetical protein
MGIQPEHAQREWDEEHMDGRHRPGRPGVNQHGAFVSTKARPEHQAEEFSAFSAANADAPGKLNASRNDPYSGHPPQRSGKFCFRHGLSTKARRFRRA